MASKKVRIESSGRRAATNRECTCTPTYGARETHTESERKSDREARSSIDPNDTDTKVRAAVRQAILTSGVCRRQYSFRRNKLLQIAAVSCPRDAPHDRHFNGLLAGILVSHVVCPVFRERYDKSVRNWSRLVSRGCRETMKIIVSKYPMIFWISLFQKFCN